MAIRFENSDLQGTLKPSSRGDRVTLSLGAGEVRDLACRVLQSADEWHTVDPKQYVTLVCHIAVSAEESKPAYLVLARNDLASCPEVAQAVKEIPEPSDPCAWHPEDVKQELLYRSLQTTGKVNALFGRARFYIAEDVRVYSPGKTVVARGGEHEVTRGETMRGDPQAIRSIANEDMKWESSKELAWRQNFYARLPNDPLLLKPGIVVYRTGSGKQRFVEVTPYCNSGSLKDCMHTFNGQQRLVIAEQMVRSVSILHAHGIKHCDLKPANWMVHVTGDEVIVRLGDLNGAQVEPQGERPFPERTTFLYLAPEAVTRWLEHDRRLSDRTTQDDCWALGLSLYQLATGSLPNNLIQAAQQGHPCHLAKYFAEHALRELTHKRHTVNKQLSKIASQLSNPNLTQTDRAQLLSQQASKQLEEIALNLWMLNSTERWTAAQAQEALANLLAQRAEI